MTTPPPGHEVGTEKPSVFDQDFDEHDIRVLW